MSVTTIARIQHRRGLKTDLPTSLNEGELGWCLDTRELFIGNSLAEGGNTQVLTSNVDLSGVITYQFVSDTQVMSQTGVTMNQPVVRTLQQQLDDAWVNVKAYGATGDGQTDDTDAIQRAITDLYSKTLTTSENISQSRKAIWFPSGVYLISDSLKLWPGVRLVGENRAHTVIQLSTDTVPNQMIELVDSLGQTGASMGNNGAVLPTHVHLEQIQFYCAEDCDILVLQKCQHVTAKECVFQGSWQRGDSVLTPSVGIRIESLGSVSAVGDCVFENCMISNVAWGYYCEQLVSNVIFHACVFTELFKGIVTDTDGLGDGPSYTRVSTCTFEGIDDMGIQVMNTNPGVQSQHNLFRDVGNTSVVEVIYWSLGSQLCTSVNDIFDRTSTPPARVYNGEPTQNMVVNAQDPINMPVP